MFPNAHANITQALFSVYPVNLVGEFLLERFTNMASGFVLSLTSTLLLAGLLSGNLPAPSDSASGPDDEVEDAVGEEISWEEVFEEERDNDLETLGELEVPEGSSDPVDPEDFFKDAESVPFVEADSWEEAEELIEEILSEDPVTTETVSAFSPTTAVPVVSKRYGPCVLYPRNVWLRKSSNYSAVGTKPLTKCSENVTRITHETKMHYKWGLWMRGAGPWIKSTNYGERTLEQKNVSYTCKGTKKKWWSAETRASIVYKNTTYRTVVTSPLDDLACKA